MVSEDKLRDVATEFLLKGIKQGEEKEQERVIQVLERVDTGLSPEQKAILMRELAYKEH